MNPNFKDHLLQVTESSACEEIEIIQSLWSGYGKISRYQLVDSPLNNVVVKFISVNQGGEHPRGWDTDYSHNRKIKSYDVETYWYEKWNQNCMPHCRVPECIGTFSDGKDKWIILEDLDVEFPVRKYDITLSEVKACLKWLAQFHGTFLGQEPTGLWKIGTYWNLETRPDEFEKIAHQGLKSEAHEIDGLLNQCKYLTIVHGDAKLANFCFSEDGKSIAAVDFQYVGGGCGMKDVAYFLGSCLSSKACDLHQNDLLDAYFSALNESLISSDSKIDFYDLEQEWRKMYPIAYTDFVRFMMGWMPSHQKINHYSLKLMNSVLSSL